MPFETKPDSEYTKQHMWLSRFVVVDAINKWLESEGHNERVKDIMIINGDVRCDLKLE